MTREYFFIIRPKYIFEMVLKKKKDMHLRVSSPIPAGRSQTRLLGQKSLLRKSLRAIKEVRKQKMQSPSNPSEPQKPLNFHRGFQEWNLVKAESWKYLEAQCQRWSQWSHQGPPWPDPSLPLHSSCTGHSGQALLCVQSATRLGNCLHNVKEKCETQEEGKCLFWKGLSLASKVSDHVLQQSPDLWQSFREMRQCWCKLWRKKKSLVSWENELNHAEPDKAEL